MQVALAVRIAVDDGLDVIAGPGIAGAKRAAAAAGRSGSGTVRVKGSHDHPPLSATWRARQDPLIADAQAVKR
jgi:hypothetical protein